ncbi:MAG: hypothetical protein DWP92_11120 [Armatimonadetes bacterium]|nr:MAG: hypothetical protein DWP92_11120 [Armatimonadota bacterium]
MGVPFLTGYVLGQHGAQSARLASSVARSTGSAKNDVLDVHDRLDRLILVVEAMWSLLEENGYTEDQLRSRVDRIDAADGVVDGKKSPRGLECRDCGSIVPAGRPACQFCGADAVEYDDGPFVGI